MMSGEKTLVPVDSEQHVHVVREYRKLLQSTMGPKGSCKAVVTGGGYLEVATTSATLSARLELASPICKFINNAVAGLVDHGLYCGVLLCHLLEQQWQEKKLSKDKKTLMLAVVSKELKVFLSSDNVRVQLNFNSINNLLPLVRTVINSKCPPLSAMDVDKLSIEIIKVFLNCVDDKNNLINKVYVKVEYGCNDSTNCKGLLYNVTGIHNIEFARELTNDFKILVFVLKLEDDQLCHVFDQVKWIFECSEKFGVKVVACQKTVSPEIKLFLRRRKIILLERMGSDFTKILIELSNAFPISQLDIEESEVGKMVGHLTSVKHITLNGSDYLLFHNGNVPVGTLFVQTTSLLGEDFVKTLILQSLTALRTAAVHPFLVVGGGCLECWLIAQFHLLKEERKDKDLSVIATWVQRALQSTCFAEELDTVYHHGWTHGADYCNCRLVRRGEVEQGGGAWLTIQEVVESRENLSKSQQPNMTLRPDVLVESLHQKLQVICTVFETLANLNDVGLIVYDAAQV